MRNSQRQMRKKAVLIGLAVFCFGILLGGCRSSEKEDSSAGLQGKIIIFHAGSLAVPVDHLIEGFQKIHPGVTFETEAAGSRAAARKVSELGREADLVMSADYQVIENLLIPEFASWNILFARNTMVLAYTDASLYREEINAENWYQVLLRDEVIFGRSDPEVDPNGYRTLMVWQLAEKYYGEPGLYQRLDQASPPENMRPKETDLIALLQRGEMDYAFNYLSVAVQHNLNYLILPEEINLSSKDYEQFYQQAQVKLGGTRPGQTLTVRGKAIIYGATIPESAPRPDLAEEFLLFVLGPQGREILREQGQPPLEPPLGLHSDRLPPELRKVVQPLEGN